MCSGRPKRFVTSTATPPAPLNRSGTNRQQMSRAVDGNAAACPRSAALSGARRETTSLGMCSFTLANTCGERIESGKPFAKAWKSLLSMDAGIHSVRTADSHARSFGGGARSAAFGVVDSACVSAWASRHAAGKNCKPRRAPMTMRLMVRFLRGGCRRSLMASTQVSDPLTVPLASKCTSTAPCTSEALARTSHNCCSLVLWKYWHRGRRWKSSARRSCQEKWARSDRAVCGSREFRTAAAFSL
mmetsp:Transcript_17593/g.54552  ORF Transcript_17593/g.54552 Transcript_17593/m.54552 type:complete len:244 (-) Transcript_17593:231-962(-)